VYRNSVKSLPVRPGTCVSDVRCVDTYIYTRGVQARRLPAANGTVATTVAVMFRLFDFFCRPYRDGTNDTPVACAFPRAGRQIVPAFGRFPFTARLPAASRPLNERLRVRSNERIVPKVRLGNAGVLFTGTRVFTPFVRSPDVPRA